MVKLKAYIKNEFDTLKNTVSIPEYIWWWIARLCMIGVIIKASVKGEDSFVIMMMELNLGMTFIIPVVRFICFPKLFFGNIPFNVQSFINVFIMTGSFLGHGFGFNGTVLDYDKVMHIISGGLVVFIGYLIINNTKTGKDLSPGLKTFAAAGLSNVVIIVWEIFEFMSDFFIEGANNQNWYFHPEENMFIYKIIGSGVAGEAQYPIVDTAFDMICAATGIVICCIILYVYIKIKEKRMIDTRIKETITQ